MRLGSTKFSLCGLAHFILAMSLSTWAFSSERRVATVTPIAHSVANALLKNTSVDVDYLPPARLPIGRISSWQDKTQTIKYPAYDVSVSIGALRPELDYSLTLRQSNIRIVNIDIAYALLPKGERVVVATPQEYFWLNSNNMLVMLGILKRDLGVLWPDIKSRIDENYQALSVMIKKTNLATDEILRQHDIAVLSSSNLYLNAISGSLSTDLMSFDEAQELGLNTLYVSDKKAKSNTMRVWLIDSFSRYSQKSLEERIKNNFASLVSVFQSASGLPASSHPKTAPTAEAPYSPAVHH